jgi:hypothetical protein
MKPWLNLLVLLPSVFLAASAPVAAVEVGFNFDAVASGSPANAVSKAGVTFEPAYYGPVFDFDGSAVPGTEAWRIDGSAPAVTVDDPSTFGRGAAPSPANALNALWQPVLVQFGAPQLIRQFSVTLDQDSFGTRGLGIGFYDGADRLLGELPVDQTIPGFSVSAPALDLVGVTKVVLPAGAFYDNLTVSSVPEPGGLTLGLLGGLCLLAIRRPGRAGR